MFVVVAVVVVEFVVVITRPRPLRIQRLSDSVALSCRVEKS